MLVKVWSRVHFVRICCFQGRCWTALLCYIFANSDWSTIQLNLKNGDSAWQRYCWYAKNHEMSRKLIFCLIERCLMTMYILDILKSTAAYMIVNWVNFWSGGPPAINSALEVHSMKKFENLFSDTSLCSTTSWVSNIRWGCNRSLIQCLEKSLIKSLMQCLHVWTSR